MFSDQKNFPNNSHGLIGFINTQGQPTTKHESNLTTYWDFQEKKTKRPVEKRKYVILPLPVMIWIIGLILAGSEGALMPYLNVAGAVVFFGASVWLGRILPCLEPDAEVREISKKKVRRSVPSDAELSFCDHDHGCAQGAHHLGMFGDKNLFCKGI